MPTPKPDTQETLDLGDSTENTPEGTPEGTPNERALALTTIAGSIHIPPSARIPRGNHPSYEALKLDGLVIDPEVQRKLRHDRVAHIAGSFQPALLGTIRVSRRPDDDGTVQDFVVDGGHRVSGALQALDAGKHPEGYDGTILAEVYSGLTRAQEAGLFVGLNDTKQIPPRDLHNAAIIMGDDRAVLVQGILDEYGVEIASKTGGIEAVNSLYFILALDSTGKLLERMFDTLIMDDLNGKGGAWQINTANKLMFSAAMMRATALIYFRNNHVRVEDASLVKAMRNYAPHVLTAQGRARFPGRAAMHGIAALLVEDYNPLRKRTFPRLEAWRPS